MLLNTVGIVCVAFVWFLVGLDAGRGDLGTARKAYRESVERFADSADRYKALAEQCEAEHNGIHQYISW